MAVVCIDGAQRTQCSVRMERSGLTPSVEPTCYCTLLSESVTLRGNTRGRKGGIRSQDFGVQDLGLRLSALGFKFEDRKSLSDTSSPSACSDDGLISFSFFLPGGEKPRREEKDFVLFFCFLCGTSSFPDLPALDLCFSPNRHVFKFPPQAFALSCILNNRP